MNEDYLNISNDFVFFSIEGENPWTNKRSVFVRLSGCNLTCKGFASKDSPNGCDSYISWCKKNPMTFEELNNYMEVRGYIDALKDGAILKITGGCPLIQHKPLYAWLNQLVTKYHIEKLHVDIETNGTVYAEEFFKAAKTPIANKDGWWYVTFTCSPKLSSNGDPESRRYKPEVLKQLNNCNAYFKFVVQSEDDIKEIFEKYIDNGLIDKQRICFMPCCGSRKEQEENAPQVVEWCKKYGVDFGFRVHLAIWDKALGV